MTEKTSERFWMKNNSGRLIIACEFASIDEARAAAANWNRDADCANRVDVIQNGPTAMGSTRVTTAA